MKKRVSRKELKEKIKTLKRRVCVLENESAEARGLAKYYSEKLFKFGSRLDMEQADITHIDVKPQPWGQYVSIWGDEQITEEHMKLIKCRLTESLVKGLIDRGLVQFIIRDSDLPFAPQTIGAKLYVIPWEETVVGRKMLEWRRFNPLDQGKSSGEDANIQDREETTCERKTGSESSSSED